MSLAASTTRALHRQPHRGLVVASAARFAGLLDLFPGAAAAWSPSRRLRAGYAGAALQVRRSSDSAVLDIGFTPAGELDEAALVAFVGAGDGFITTVYDQSESGTHPQLQADSAAQPRIVIGGAIQRIAGRPALRYADGRRLATPALDLSTTNKLFMLVAAAIEGSGDAAIVESSPRYSQNGGAIHQCTTYVGLGSVAGAWYDAKLPANPTPCIRGSRFDLGAVGPAMSQTRVNAADVGASYGGSATPTATHFGNYQWFFGRRGAGGLALTGLVGECVVFPDLTHGGGAVDLDVARHYGLAV